MIGIIYLMFFLSGAAALMYEVVWVRSLSLVFGGTHLAVTAVLAVFMGGLALGGYSIGKLVDTAKKPFRLYGYLELGIALGALAFMVLMQVYPSLYRLLAQGKDDYKLYLTVIRVLFAFFAMIAPTTLMGGTLPVLTRFVSQHPADLAPQLSRLYGLNTFGAVAGAATAGFFLLPVSTVSVTLSTAMAINVLIGITALLLTDRISPVVERAGQNDDAAGKNREQKGEGQALEARETGDLLPFRLVLIGIGVSGFCAMGYEVLWTRALTLAVGTSVYGFTIMLISFLTGIALGGNAYGLVRKMLRSRSAELRNHFLGFGIVQCIIGIVALFVTINIGDLPNNVIFLKTLFSSFGLKGFHARQWANMTLAFSYMVVPAFFMGLAFPLAGYVKAASSARVGHAVGTVLASNTIGAIFGSAVSGFLLLYLFGTERSLQMLTVINIGFGLIVMASLTKKNMVMGTSGGILLASLMFLAINQDVFRVWDEKYLAIFRNNQTDAFNSPERRQDAIENTDVLFFDEGLNSTISVIQPKGAYQAVLVNGKVVASSSPADQQCQLTLGHLPMLLHKHPRRVLVVGLGTGMTLGAASVHPEVEELTLAEIEPKVLGAARTFGKYNNFVLDNPKLKIILTDGRNFLTTTKNRYDVITADPIHPWTQGSGYLYTEEYFRTASEHLGPGGIMCQWLPIYELTVDDLKSVVRTFSRSFKYTMTWLTHYDAEIIGSNSPIVIDEQDLERRIAHPAVLNDLSRVMMGSATDFLSYFLMGTERMKAFSDGGAVNTDDNLYLEFSAPRSAGVNVMGVNVSALGSYRESLLPYLVPAPAGDSRAKQIQRWADIGEAASVYDRAHVLYLRGYKGSREFPALMAELDKKYPAFAPGKMLKQLMLNKEANIPTLLRNIPFAVMNKKGGKIVTVVSAVRARISKERAALIFVDNKAKKIYGQVYFSGTDLGGRMMRFLNEVEQDLQAAYREETGQSRNQGKELPSAGPMKVRIGDIIEEHIETEKGSQQLREGSALSRAGVETALLIGQ